MKTFRPFRVCMQLCLREEDTPQDRQRKLMVIPVAFVGGFLALLAWVEEEVFVGGHRFQAQWTGYLLLAVLCVALWIRPFLTRKLSLEYTGNVAVAIGWSILLADWGNAAVPGHIRVWPIAILVMDIFLALNVNRLRQGLVLHSTALWIVVASVEEAFRLGLYDIEGWTQYPDSMAREFLCSCSDPPCARGIFPLLTNAGAFLLILYCDFFATRSFAEGLRASKSKVDAAVDVADQVAASLSRFDLDGAERALEAADGAFPKRLRESYVVLVKNLASYRPYLPQSVFEHDRNPVGESGYVSSPCTPGAGQSGRGRLASLEQGGLVSPVGATPANSGPLVNVVRRTGSGTSAGFAAPTSTEVSMSASSQITDDQSMTRCSSAHTVLCLTAHVPRARRVTLFARNCSGLLTVAAQAEPGTVSAWLASEVDRFVTVVCAQGGMTDLLSADHLSASYGALKAQGTQCDVATRTAFLLTTTLSGDDDVSGSGFTLMASTSAVVCGRALCGDFGSSLAQRFMVIGGVSAFLPAVERAAAAWGVAVLIDPVVQLDIEQFWSCRLRRKVRFPKLGTSEHLALWEVLQDNLEGCAGAADEWMYELEKVLVNPWMAYNTIVTQWCTGSAAEALAGIERLRSEGSSSAEEGVPQEVSLALAALAEALQGDCPPPIGELSAAAMAGDPAPVVPRDIAAEQQQQQLQYQERAERLFTAGSLGRLSRSRSSGS